MKKEIVGLVIGILIFLILLLIYSGESLLNLGKEASQAAEKIYDTSTSVVENLVTRSDEEEINIVEKIRKENLVYLEKRYDHYACNDEYTIRDLCIDLNPYRKHLKDIDKITKKEDREHVAKLYSEYAELCNGNLDNFKKHHEENGLMRKSKEWCENSRIGNKESEVDCSISSQFSSNGTRKECEKIFEETRLKKLSIIREWNESQITNEEFKNKITKALNDIPSDSSLDFNERITYDLCRQMVKENIKIKEMYKDYDERFWEFCGTGIYLNFIDIILNRSD